MRINSVLLDGFKNLNKFSIEFDKNKMHTVLLGQNAAGKSNFLEALVIIFRDLDLNDKVYSDFDFDITYECQGFIVRIIGNKEDIGKEEVSSRFIEKQKSGFTFYINNLKTAKSTFYKSKGKYLPKHVFSYYSGISNRLEEHFDLHQRRFLKDLLGGLDDPMRPLFYARHIHSHFVLMAFYGFPEKKIQTFLKDYLNIMGLESILFVLKNPYWYKNKPIKGGDEKFWYARGVVKDFLNDLWDASLAPVPFNEKVREDFHKNPEQEHFYLYISSQEKLVDLAKKYGNNANFFKMLESTYISDLIHEVRVKVRKQNIKGRITFKELSEGEQQLLTVLGLMRFTKESDTLFLLDEPDTHLNPMWKWSYIELMENVVDRDTSSQVIMTTHDPLVIGGLTKEEIRIFSSIGTEKNIYTSEPEFDPKGLGVAGILTSDLFGLPTSLDKETLELINKRNTLIAKQDLGELNNSDRIVLNEIFQILGDLGINTTDRDPLYEKFLIELSKTNNYKIEKLTTQEIEEQNKVAKQIMDKLLKRDIK